MIKEIVCINGSTHGAAGNCSRLAGLLERYIAPRARLETIHLADGGSFEDAQPRLARAAGFLFLTGTYWDSWGSPLQKFLEDATESEGSPLWLGKPCGVAVLMHSVGGKGVVSRLQGVLNTLGLVIPPMTGFVYSTVNQIALERHEDPRAEDLWRIADLEIVCHNLLEACFHSANWRSWPVDRSGFDNVWLEE